ncbi:MAG: electron transfer flavoprotein subunit alpha/FixB family protein [Deltaproteobacteria bacterium]|nr:electron transfer flavoprotein subunit alpha/FixB family protein [Deltaproteobacteria bacterium]
MVFFISTGSSATDCNALNATGLLARAINARVAALVIEGPAPEHTDVPDWLDNRVDEVYIIEGAQPDETGANLSAYAAAKTFASVLKDKRPAYVVCAASGQGSGNVTAALIAVALDMPCVVNITTLEYRDGNITASRPIYGARLVETLSVKGPAVLSIAGAAFKSAAASNRPATVHRIKPLNANTQSRVRVKSRAHAQESGDISTAQVIVSGGRGLGGPEGFKMLNELASLVGGVVGASRGAVDAGWTTPARQVGQTGKTVSPHIYVACGISGAPQHLAGMRTSELIMAINKDPNAPIMHECDLGIKADLREFIPLLIEELKHNGKRDG